MRKTIYPLLIALMTSMGVTAQTHPYQDPSLPAEVRARDLCSRLTLEEKASLMKNASPAIERFGIPQFDWWSEALHGIARNGFATVFPATIGMAASFDDELFSKCLTPPATRLVQKLTPPGTPASSSATKACRSGHPTSTSSVTPDGEEGKRLMERIPT